MISETPLRVLEFPYHIGHTPEGDEDIYGEYWVSTQFWGFLENYTYGFKYEGKEGQAAKLVGGIGSCDDSREKYVRLFHALN